MFRESTNAGAMFADLVLSPENGVNLQWRTSDNGSCGFTGIGMEFTAVWLELMRQGTNFTASYSPDGLNWSTIGTISIPMPYKALAGLAVTAHNNAALCLVAIDHVSVISSNPPPLLNASRQAGRFY